MKSNTESSWESRMAHRAKLAAMKRRIRTNLEGEAHEADYWQGTIVFSSGFDHADGIATKEDEWPDVVGDSI